MMFADLSGTNNVLYDCTSLRWYAQCCTCAHSSRRCALVDQIARYYIVLQYSRMSQPPWSNSRGGGGGGWRPRPPPGSYASVLQLSLIVSKVHTRLAKMGTEQPEMTIKRLVHRQMRVPQGECKPEVSRNEPNDSFISEYMQPAA